MAIDPRTDPHARIVVRSLEHAPAKGQPAAKPDASDPYRRAANEDDDGYDPYSDRPAAPDPLFQEDPWN